MAAPENCQAQERKAADNELIHLNCLIGKAGQAMLKVQHSWLETGLSPVSIYIDRRGLGTVP